MRYLALIMLVGCTSADDTAFEYNAVAAWAIEYTPNVTSVTIDGRAVASHEQYTLSETYPSYDDALASFVPHPVVVTTTTQTLTFSIDIGACTYPSSTLTAPLIKETDHFDLHPGLQDATALGFGVQSGTCESVDGTLVTWAARTR